MSLEVKGAWDGIQTVSAWFNQFPTFGFDASKDIIDEFGRLSSYRQLRKKAERAHFRALTSVVAVEVSKSKSKTKYDSFALPFFAKFPKFNHKSSETVSKEFQRLVGDQRWPKWKESSGMAGKPIRLLRRVVEETFSQRLDQPLKEAAERESDILSKKLSSLNDKIKGKAKNHPAVEKESRIPVKSFGGDQIIRIRPTARSYSGDSSDTVSDFFEQFDTFDHDPVADLVSEFDRLAIQQKWAPGSKQYYRRRTECLAKAFQDDFQGIGPLTIDDEDDEDDDGEGGAGVSLRHISKLAHWQTLCGELGIEPIPPTMTQCRKALKALKINLVDLVEARNKNRYSKDGLVQVQRFASEAALARYTLKTPGKIFPKKIAKRSGAIGELLIRVF